MPPRYRRRSAALLADEIEDSDWLSEKSKRRTEAEREPRSSSVIARRPQTASAVTASAAVEAGGNRGITPGSAPGHQRRPAPLVASSGRCRSVGASLKNGDQLLVDPVLDQLGGEQGGRADRDDLIVVPVHDQRGAGLPRPGEHRGSSIRMAGEPD